MKIIAISGWKKSGKDTLAQYLIDNYGAKRFSFADALKDMVSRDYGVNRSDLDDQSKKELPILSLPVEPQDKFTNMIAEFMRGEFRDQNGKKYSEGTPESNMYWTPRALAILLGSVNRSVRSDYWVAKTLDDISKSGEGFKVIADLRYKSEVKQLRDKFGNDLITIRVNRFDTSPSVDPSERDLDDQVFDFVIENRGTLEEAFDKLDQIVAF